MCGASVGVSVGWKWGGPRVGQGGVGPSDPALHPPQAATSVPKFHLQHPCEAGMGAKHSPLSVCSCKHWKFNAWSSSLNP